MRVIKENNVAYKSFHKSLPNLTKLSGSKSSLRLVQLDPAGTEADTCIIEAAGYLAIVTEFQKNILGASSPGDVKNSLTSAIKKIIHLSNIEIFLFDESESVLIPAFDKGEKNFNMLINELYKKGNLEQVFKANKPVVIPSLTELTGKNSNLNYLFIPVSNGDKKRALVSVLTSAVDISTLVEEVNAVNLCFGIAIDKAELLLKKEQLKSAYSELQLYQSKMTNDYKLLAIGELTSGIVEDVLSPLQVILGYTEFLNQENGVDEEIPVNIKKQVKKVETIIDRLVKFASINDGKAKIQPCDLNEHITVFYEMIASSLKNDNYECVLDLEEDIPSIISHPVHLNQLLSNLFTLVKASGTTAGGILIQTRCSKETITLRVLSTDYIESLDKSAHNSGQDINFGIIKNLAAKHEGEIKAESGKASGTNIILSFPLKRKMI